MSGSAHAAQESSPPPKGPNRRERRRQRKADKRAAREAEREGNLGVILTLFGSGSQLLKEKLILPGATLIGSLGAVAVPRLWTTASGDPCPAANWVAIGFAVVAGASVLLDKVADRYEKVLTTETLDGVENSAQNMIKDLNAFIEDALRVGFQGGNTRAYAIRSLRSDLVQAAVKAAGPGSRATYYHLDDSTPGQRVLGSPVHATGYGRRDKPRRPFVEAEDPDLDIWRVMDAPDEEADIKVFGRDEVVGLDWSRKKYRTFLSVPVKAEEAQFGLLSVNNVDPNALGPVERETILALARALALVLSMETGPQNLAALQSALAPVSGAPTNVQVVEDSGAQGDAKVESGAQSTPATT